MHTKPLLPYDVECMGSSVSPILLFAKKVDKLVFKNFQLEYIGTIVIQLKSTETSAQY